MFKETGVDGIMIGRGAFGNPWIFQKIIHYLQTGEKLEDVSSKEKLEVIKKHFNLELQEKGEYVAIREFRKHLAVYSKNMARASDFRTYINKIEDKDELMQALDKFFAG